MRIDDFEFETDSLGYSSIEDEICRGCGLGDPQSSNLRVEEKEGKRNVNILSKNGSVSCCILVFKGKEKKYRVRVSAINVEKHK